MKQLIRRFFGWISRRQSPLTLAAGSFIVTIWTVLRHITNGINFDVVGQVGVAGQWLHGIHGGVQLGSTNYLLKMPIYALINLMGFIEPRVRLLILALIFNISTFLLIYWLLRKILRLYEIKSPALLNLGMLWLATISGRVFWVDYANSRNLEVAGGIAVLYLVLKLWSKPNIKTALGLFVLSGIVFFADPLQLYAIGGGIVIFGIFRLLTPRLATERVRTVISLTALAAGGGLAKVLAWISAKILLVEFLKAPRADLSINPESIKTIAENTLTSTLRIFDINIFDKALSVNSVRQFGGLILMALATYIIVGYKNDKLKQPTLILSWLILWSYAIYIASGNIMIPISERYLVMVPIIVILMLAMRGNVFGAEAVKRLCPIWLGIVALSTVLLLGAVYVNWPNRFSLDRPMFAMADFAKLGKYDYLISSRGLAIPANYYAGYGHTIVPAICLDNKHIGASNLFYDRAGYDSKIKNSDGTVAIIIPDEGIISSPFQCTIRSILEQLGKPQSENKLEGVGGIYEYPSDTPALRAL